VRDVRLVARLLDSMPLPPPSLSCPCGPPMGNAQNGPIFPPPEGPWNPRGLNGPCPNRGLLLPSIWPCPGPVTFPDDIRGAHSSPHRIQSLEVAVTPRGAPPHAWFSCSSPRTTRRLRPHTDISVVVFADNTGVSYSSFVMLRVGLLPNLCSLSLLPSATRTRNVSVALRRTRAQEPSPGRAGGRAAGSSGARTDGQAAHADGGRSEPSRARRALRPAAVCRGLRPAPALHAVPHVVRAHALVTNHHRGIPEREGRGEGAEGKEGRAHRQISANEGRNDLSP